MGSLLAFFSKKKKYKEIHYCTKSKNENENRMQNNNNNQFFHFFCVSFFSSNFSYGKKLDDEIRDIRSHQPVTSSVSDASRNLIICFPRILGMHLWDVELCLTEESSCLINILDVVDLPGPHFSGTITRCWSIFSVWLGSIMILL